MAQTTTLIICPACGHFIGALANQCPLCKAELEKAAKEGTVVEASLQARRPTAATVEAVLAASERAAAITGKEIGQALLNFLIACAIGVAMFFFGRWVVSGFRGPGVLVFGYVPILAAPCLVILGFVQLFSGLFSRRRGKTPKAAFVKVWESGYFNGLMFTNAAGAAAARVYRSLPDIPGGPSAVDLAAYVEALKRWVEGMLDAEEAGLATAGRWNNGVEEDVTGWHADLTGPTLVPGSVIITALAPNVQEVTGVLQAVRKRTHSVSDNKTNELVRCTLRMTITCYCVHRGKYWLVTDAMPDLPAMPAATLEPLPE